MYKLRPSATLGKCSSDRVWSLDQKVGGSRAACRSVHGQDSELQIRWQYVNMLEEISL